MVIASNAFAVDRWIPIAGTVGNFRTDARILNPSGEKDIEISAYFLPVNVTNNNERIAGAPVKIAVPKRSMKVLDDVVASVFSATGLGAILFTSPDEFVFGITRSPPSSEPPTTDHPLPTTHYRRQRSGPLHRLISRTKGRTPWFANAHKGVSEKPTSIPDPAAILMENL